MSPGKPEDQTEPDPFEGIVDDDDGIDWIEEAPTPAHSDMFAPVDDADGDEDLDFPESVDPPGPAEVPDFGGTDDLDEERIAAEFDTRVTLPWRTVATIDGAEIPTLLSPSMPTSTWRGGPENLEDTPITVELGGMEIRVKVEVVPGAPTLVLGRDALKGRVRIEV